MKIINSPRRSGKTTILIHASYATGAPIIVYDRLRADNLLKYAKDLGCDVEVYTIEEWVRYVNKTSHEQHILVDDAERILEKALEEALHAKVIACTTTIPFADANKKE